MKVAQDPTFVYLNANGIMEQPKRPRPLSLYIQVPRSQPVVPTMSYNRQLSPGSRRIQNPARVSDTLAEPYRYERHNSYTLPRSSGGVIPISTQTFVNVPPPSSSRPEPRHDSYAARTPTDSYSGRPRRNSLVDTQRGSAPSVTTLPSRSRPTVIQDEFARPSSPQKSSRDKDYHVVPGSTKEPRKVEHKKLYSVNDGTANLVADVNVPAGGERHHKRRESDSGERGYRNSGMDRGRRGYHLNGPSAQPPLKSIEDDDAYSYTDPASMYKDTEPRWREREVRPRRGSVDRGGASRERPVSMLDPALDPRKSNKEIGPPPSTRGWDKVNELGRATSVRDRPRDLPMSPTRARVPQSPTRARVPHSPTRGRYPEAGAYGDPRDQYYVPPRTTSEDRRNSAFPPERPVERYEQHGYDERREPRRPERRNSVTRGERPDHSIERRGFGIRGDSQDRYGGRGSDESFNQQNKYRDSGYAVAEPHRRDTAPELNYHEERRLEQEKIERAAAERLKNEERERQWEREAREKEQRRREEDRVYNRDYDRERDQRRERDRVYDMDRERERERERMMQPQPEPERHHHRHESNRDRDYGSKENAPRSSGETLAQPGLSTAAATGLAGAAATYGLNKAVNRGDDRDKERDREQDRRYDKQRDYERDRLSPQPRDTRPKETHSDEGMQYQEERDRRVPEQDRGLGFAFENAPEPPQPPRSAPPMRDHPDLALIRDRVEERDFERQHEDKSQAQMPQPAIDPEEDYRRRMEQVQRELGRAAEERHSESDPDRERRRREREQRQRERDMRNGEASTVGSTSTFDSAASSRLPGTFENDSVDGTNSTTSTRPGLTRKPSILDQPMMTNEPVQIIDNSMSEKRENRVRIVDPPTEEEERKPKGILKRPTEKFPEHPNAVREGVAPLKDVRLLRNVPRITKYNMLTIRRLASPASHQALDGRRSIVAL